MVCQVVYDVVQRIVHHAVEVKHREARVGLGGSARSADLAMPSARAAACAASPRTGVRRHARVRDGKHFLRLAPVGLSSRGARTRVLTGPRAPAAVGACALLIKCVILVLGISGLRGFGASQYL